MKLTNGRQILNFTFCFFLILGVALATHGLAEEYYTYQDANGKLVISNKKPPPGSKIIKKQELPDPADNESGTAQGSKAPSAEAPEKGTNKPKQ